MKKFELPLMDNNIDREDINELITFLQQDPLPRLTNGPKVRELEKKWSEWLGVKHSIFVNSGTAANELTMLALKYFSAEGEIIVPPLTWVSDINSVLFAGYKPVFVDINLKNLSFDIRAIFLTHVLGINGLTQELLDICKENQIALIEDVCESHGATFNNKKLGSFGFASNFSFYFAHHMSTIEGGMVCTNDDVFYEFCRSLRSHGMVREFENKSLKETWISRYPDLNKDFIFIGPAHNFRSTELNAVLGLSQLKKLNSNNQLRKDNFDYFIKNLDSKKYITNLNMEGQCNYAFIVILKEPNFKMRDKIEKILHENNIEFRRGLSGGGNQLRQPFFANKKIDFSDFKNIDHVHNFGWYIGNYPSLERKKIDKLLTLLNE